MDEPAFTGCVLKGRIVGIIEGQQSGDDGKERNDRVVAIEQDNHSFADLSKSFAVSASSSFRSSNNFL
jgi:inorganic pyrophosphatase